jgi:hypothetical protein
MKFRLEIPFTSSAQGVDEAIAGRIIHCSAIPTTATVPQLVIRLYPFSNGPGHSPVWRYLHL